MTIAETNFQDFLEEVIEGEMVFTIEDEAGTIPCPTSSNEKNVMPFWSSAERVEKVIRTVPAYAGCKPKGIELSVFLEKWLPGLIRDGLDVGINWSGRKALGYDMEPADLKTELETILSGESEEDSEPSELH